MDKTRDRTKEAYIYTDKDRRAKFERYAKSRGRTMKAELSLYIDSLPDLPTVRISER